MKLKSKIIITVLFVFTVVFVWKSYFCYYNYAVNTEETSLPYRTYYYFDYERNKEFDFSTVLFSLQNTQKDFTNYSSFTVYLSHLHRPYNKNTKGVYVSEIHFQNFSSDDDIQINVESIKLLYKTKDGEVIPSIRTEKDFIPNTKSKGQSRLFSKYYDINCMPNKVIEYVYIEVLIDGKSKIIEFTFPVEKTYHYSAFDVAMGV
ncbi:MAG: hypothetical protein GY845_35350 [Planctomycetes bacterium]|nr:hypothetical protein [Planctomycetota bacterium]